MCGLCHNEEVATGRTGKVCSRCRKEFGVLQREGRAWRERDGAMGGFSGAWRGEPPTPAMTSTSKPLIPEVPVLS